MLLTNRLRALTPLLNSYFEITYKGNGNNSLLTEITQSYELRADSNILIVKYYTSIEDLYNLINSIETVHHINILLHDNAGNGLLKFSFDTKSIGPVVKQSIESNDLFTYHAAFKITNLSTVAFNSNE